MRHLLALSLCVVFTGCHPRTVVVQNHSCSNFVQDGDESDIDCGGAQCGRCGDGRVCIGAADCASGVCSSSGHCQEGAFTVPADVYAIQGNAGAVVAPGTQAGFAILAASGGSSFRLIWTGDGAVTGTYHEFYGSIYTDGQFASVTQGCGDGSCGFGHNDYLSTPYPVPGGERIDFDSPSATALKGFDFVVNGGASGIGEPVYFDLFVDGQYIPDAIFFTDATTGQSAFPQTIPFGLQTQ